MVEGTVALFFHLGFPVALVAIAREHAPVYRRYGFRTVAGTACHHHAEFGVDVVCLEGHRDRIPGAVRERVARDVADLRSRGSLCRCPAWPACATSFCSLRARTLLSRRDRL